MKVGKTLELIRKSKNMSISELCGDSISRQTYFRIVHESVDTSFSKFNHLLTQLNVTYDEFLFINNNYSVDRTHTTMDKARYFFETRDVEELSKLKKKYSLKETNTLKERHVFYLISIYHCVIKKEDYSAYRNAIKDYLINIETWTHYELILFNNVIFIFNNVTIELLANKCTMSLQKYSKLRIYGNEGFRMNLNIILVYINRKNYFEALIAIERLSLIHLKEDDLYERLSLKYFLGLKSIFLGDKSGYTTCEKVLDILKFLDSDSTFKMFENYLEEFKKINYYEKESC